MSEDNTVVRGCSELVVGVALGLLACLIISLCSCRSGKVVTETIEKPVIVTQDHHTESVRVDVIRDTIRQRDSIFHYIKGDTTIIERWHYHTTANNVVRVDTLIKVDSVQVPVVTERTVTEVKEVAKPLNWLQKTLIAIGGGSIVLALLYFVYRFRKK